MIKRLILILLMFASTGPLTPLQGAEKLSLRTCIDIALKNQPAIVAAREGVNAGQGRVTQATSPYLPQVSASTGYSESRSLGGALGDSISKSYATSLSINQVIYDFGKTGSTLDAARLGTRSLERDLERVVQETILNVKQSYFALLAARKLLVVAQKTVEQAESHLKQAEAFFRSGSKPRFDVTRAEVEVNNAALGLINGKNNVRLSTISLCNVMGIDPSSDVDIDDILSAPASIPPMEQALTESLKNRPDMLKAGADIDAARATVKANQSNYLPTLSANGAYSWAHGTSEMGPYNGDIQNSWNAGVTLSMPLFEGGLTNGKVSEAKANLRTLEAQRSTLRQSIVVELNQAYADIESATARMAVMELSLKKAQESLDLAQGRYEDGVGPYMEITDAQVASVSAETNHVQALYDYQLATARLYKAMGQGLEQ